MKYSLKEARNKQDECKRISDSTSDPHEARQMRMDVIFWSGYISAMIDHDYPPIMTRGVDIGDLKPFRGKVELLPVHNGLVDDNVCPCSLCKKNRKV